MSNVVGIEAAKRLSMFVIVSTVTYTFIEHNIYIVGKHWQQMTSNILHLRDAIIQNHSRSDMVYGYQRWWSLLYRTSDRTITEWNPNMQNIRSMCLKPHYIYYVRYDRCTYIIYRLIGFNCEKCVSIQCGCVRNCWLFYWISIKAIVYKLLCGIGFGALCSLMT